MTFDYDAELSRYQRRLWAAVDVQPDDEVLDIGCGEGLTTREAAKVSASALGVDISERMVETARERSEGVPNVRFEQADVEKHPFVAEQFSLAVSRFGTMFFADPTAAFANIARALRPGGRFVQLVWQDGVHQEWVAVFRQNTDGAAFSLADPAMAERLLSTAGFAHIEFTDVREPVYYGSDAEAAFDAASSLGMAHEDERRRLLDVLAAHENTDGVWLDSRAWIITAVRQS